jgi:hypothetical protein
MKPRPFSAPTFTIKKFKKSKVVGEEFNLDFQHFKSHLTHLELQANVRIFLLP